MSVEPGDLTQRAIIATAGAGLSAMAIGAIGGAPHLLQAAQLGASLCGPAAPMAMLRMAASASMQCWGCPTMLAGSLLVLGAGIAALLPTEDPDRAGSTLHPARPSWGRVMASPQGA